MIDVSLILFILIDYQKESLGIPTTIPAESHQIKSCKDKKEERSFHNGQTVVLRAAVILNMTTVEDNYVRYCQNFKKRYLNQILES